MALPNKIRRKRRKKRDATSIIFIVILIVVLSIVAFFYWDSHRYRVEDNPSAYDIVGLNESEEDAIGPQYSEEKKAFLERLNQMMRIRLDMDTIE